MCPERMDVAEPAVLDLAEAMRILGIKGWTLPNIRERFVASYDPQRPELGRAGKVTETDAEIVFDERFRTQELQAEYEAELRAEGLDYPGMEQVYKHELAHLAMWSVTGLRHQAAVRLIDEGWATIVERLGTDEALTVAELVEGLKIKVKGLKEEEPEVYERCMDLEHPVSHLFPEDLGEAEYNVGAALLLWIREMKGQDAMIDLIRKAPTTSRRTSTESDKIPANLMPDVHTGYEAYQHGVVDPIRNEELTPERMQQISDFARKWEAAQFKTALLEVTEFESVAEAREEFELWLAN